MLIACQTIIGFGVPTRAGTAKAHSEALGAEEVAGATQGARLAVSAVRHSRRHPRRLARHRRRAASRARSLGERAERAARPRLRATFDDALADEIPASLATALNELKKKMSAEKPALATRKASEGVLEVINALVPKTIGGSADLTARTTPRPRT